MNIFDFFNTGPASCLIIILIAFDYLRKYSTDNFQRKLLIILLCAIFFAALFDYIGLTLERQPGEKTGVILLYIWSIYLIARNCSFYYSAVFIDYFAHGNAPRTKKFFVITSAFIFLYTISVIFNLRYGYYFYISRDNIYVPGTLYPLQLFFSYFPIILILVNVSITPKFIKKTQVYLIMVFVILTAVGAAIDIVLGTTNIIWSCVTSAILYIYFFIIRSDSQVDSLTGIGNRNSFFEYIKKISKESNQKKYAFIKIDIDRFKEINYNFGHLEGNNALRDIAAIIKGCIRRTDFAARLGDDEFILIASAESDISRIIDRIKNSINAQNKKQIRPYQLYISHNFDIYTNDMQIQDFLAQLDRNLYTIKNKLINDGEQNV
ncbi:MAG: GGDEF domain-containing protein [Treponema sp.]|jgi:diguanylate cyclase (GGDEF)-like protein|nr:GGDEF domain-containing protein [Treponema sp.]